MPAEVETATKAYRQEMDIIESFLQDCVKIVPNGREKANDVFLAYKKWAQDNNEYLMPESKFKSDMTKHNFALKKDSNDGWVYVGIKLNSDQKGHDFGLDLVNEDEDK